MVTVGFTTPLSLSFYIGENLFESFILKENVLKVATNRQSGKGCLFLKNGLYLMDLKTGFT